MKITMKSNIKQPSVAAPTVALTSRSFLVTIAVYGSLFAAWIATKLLE